MTSQEKDRIDDTCWFINDGNTNATIDDVVAWMPLPEPYEEDDRICINADEIHGGVLKTIPIFGEEDPEPKPGGK